MLSARIELVYLPCGGLRLRGNIVIDLDLDGFEQWLTLLLVDAVSIKLS